MLLLPPGTYRLRVTATGYQAQELHQLELAVSARLEIGFRLRPLSEVWETGMHRSIFLPGTEALVTFYGPDVDTSRTGAFEATKGTRGTLESTLSQVIDPVEVRELPLAGRDVYTMLVAQPGVTADAGTARGLGLSVNGQRPSASNFLLDGVESNNYLVTGPLMPLAPEGVQEYRVSTANFSAEFGRTSGYLANAVTRGGGSEWHGIGYFHLKDDVLFANEFQNNRLGLPRSPYSETQAGVQAGGPVWGKRWFGSGAFDYLRSRSWDAPQQVLLPTTEFAGYAPENSISRKLLAQYPPPAVTRGILPVAPLEMAQSVSLNRHLALGRMDYAGTTHRGIGRLSAARTSRPDFLWSPYPDFVSGLVQATYGILFSGVASLRPGTANEFRAGWSSDRIEWHRAHPEIPTLASFDGTVLPGSAGFYDYRNRGWGLEIADSFAWSTGRQLLKFGGGFLLRHLDGYLTAGRDARYLFADFLDFAFDTPVFFSAPLARKDLPEFRPPEFQREYRFAQFQLFAQDTVRIGERWVLNAGLRWEHFGSPVNAGAVKDGVVDMASGGVTVPQGGAQRLYSTAGVWAPRFGFAFSPRRGGNLVLRGAYGLFFDRPFDNLWQNVRNNNFVLPNFLAAGGNYLEPVKDVLKKYEGQPYASDFPLVTKVDGALANGYAQTAFTGLEYRWAQSWTAQVSGVAALGRKLLTTDIWNRGGENHQPGLPLVFWRSSQGLSNYYGLAVGFDYRSRTVRFHGVYTWGHAIDVQSEPLAGDFFDLSFVRAGVAGGRSSLAAFTRQGDSRGDRGNSDFDQRHNLVIHSIWEIPRFLAGRRAGLLFRDWQVSQLAAFRTGFPYSVLVSSDTAYFNNRADLIEAPYTGQPVEGGRRVLRAAAFTQPPSWRPGNTGRNALRGPGLYNIDVSVARTFRLGWIGEAARLRLRVDVYNLFNHANLNQPENHLGLENFGVALYGREGREGGFPALVPFRESPRNIQILLRLEF
jgi:hypothetical protein